MKRATTYDLTTEEGWAAFQAHVERNRVANRDFVLADISTPEREATVREIVNLDIKQEIMRQVGDIVDRLLEDGMVVTSVEEQESDLVTCQRSIVIRWIDPASDET